MKTFLLSIFTLMFVLGCNQDADKLKQRADLEGEGQTQGQQRAEAQRAAAMEVDLATRQNFYQSVAGDYEGNLSGVGPDGKPIKLKIKLTFIPSLPPYKAERVRAMDEVTSDINNLFLTVHVKQWDPDDQSIVFGCTFENVRPDLVNGVITLAKEGCQTLYKLRVFETDPSKPAPTQKDLEELSQKISQEVLSGERPLVPELLGLSQSIKTVSNLNIKVKKK